MKKIHRSWMYMIKNQLEQSRFDHRKQGILQASSDENNETIKSNCVYFRDRVLVRTCYSRYGKKNKVGTSASKLKFFIGDWIHVRDFKKAKGTYMFL